MTVRIIKPKDKLAWHAARAKYVTASVAGTLLGVHPYSTPYRLWAEKTSRVSRDDVENEMMRRGRLFEPVAVLMLQEDHPHWSFDYRRDDAFYCDDALRIGATPDCFSMRADTRGMGILQIKTTSEENFKAEWCEELEDGELLITPPDWICIQAIIEAKLAKADWAHVGVMVIGSRSIDMHLIEVPIHEGIWQTIVYAVDQFWKMVDSGDHPPPDWDNEIDQKTIGQVFGRTRPTPIDMSDDAAFDGIIANFAAIREERKLAQKNEAALRARILYTMEDHDAAETANWRVKAASSTTDDGKSSRRITIKERR